MKAKFFKGLVAGLVLTVSSAANAGLLLAVNNSNDTLVSIDTDSLVVSTIGSLGTNVSFGGLAYDFLTNTVYLAGGRGNNNLYTVDQTTGAATLVGSHGVNDLFAIAFDTANNTLFGTQFSGGSGLFTLDTSTGSATVINPNMAQGIGGLTYNHLSDELIGMQDGAGDIHSIDRANGMLTLLHNGAFVNDSGFAFDADKNVYWDLDYSGNLYSYDIANSYARTNHLSGIGNFDGLVYLNSTPQNGPNEIPEPSVFALIALGLLSFASRKFKR